MTKEELNGPDMGLAKEADLTSFAEEAHLQDAISSKLMEMSEIANRREFNHVELLNGATEGMLDLTHAGTNIGKIDPIDIEFGADSLGFNPVKDASAEDLMNAVLAKNTVLAKEASLFDPTNGSLGKETDK
jgi:hypothetical protein